MPKITLDAEAFKVLASDTRLQILKSLDERPKTVSELSRELALNKATVHEHLQQLLAGELIKKNEREGRKWVYYTLSWKGKHLLHPENTTVLVLLGLALAGSAGAMIQLGNWLRWWGATRVFDGAGDAGTEEDGTGELDAEPSGDPESAKLADDSSDDTQATQSASNDTEGADGTTPPVDEGNDTAGSGDAPWDFLGDSDFWLFGVLFLLSTALVVTAMLVKQRARGQTLGSIEATPATIGTIRERPPGTPTDDPEGAAADSGDQSTSRNDTDDGSDHDRDRDT